MEIDQKRMRALRKRANAGDFDAYDEYCDIIEAHRRERRQEAEKGMRKARLMGDAALYERMRKQMEDNE